MDKHYVIIPDQNNEPTQHPLKRWVRQNLNPLPIGFNADGTSHEWRRSLQQIGWRIIKAENEVLVVKPDANGHFDYANDFINEVEQEAQIMSEEAEDAFEITFGLERDLQAALRRNISSLENGLVIIDGSRERSTVAGRIDITARDNENKTVIIELKAVDAKPEVIAQTLSYMEAVRAEDDCEVRGIIIASGFPERVKLAARQIQNLKLVEYRFQFNFNSVQ
jgi:RecB family endonuclease NucS